ncbi:MAG: redoxin domain-containing protein, partial [Bacteroidota bacterium]
MKPIISWTLSVFLISISPMLYGQSIKYSPKKPSPGDEITITYKPKGGKLEGKELNGALMYVENGKHVLQLIELPQEGEAYTFEIKTPDSVLAIAIQFSEAPNPLSQAAYENYYLPLVDKTSKEVLQGAYGSLGEFFGNRYYSSAEELLESKKFIEKEWALWPESRNKFWYEYAIIAQNGNFSEASEKVRVHLDNTLQSTTSTEEELNQVFQIVQATDKSGTETDSISKIIIEKFPDGEVAAEWGLNDFFVLTGLEDQEQFFIDYQEKFKQTEFLRNGIQSMAAGLVRGFAFEQNWEKVDTYIVFIDKRRNQAQLLNEIALRLGGETLEGFALNLDKAGELSQRALNLIQQEKRNHEPDSEGNDFVAFSLELEYASYLDTYAMVSYKQGDKALALALQQEAMDKSPGPDPGMTDRYFVYLQEGKSPSELISLIEEKIVAGQQTPTMMDLHKKLMFENMSVNDIYQRYLGTLSKERLKGQMMDQEAPLFTLTDLDGETVSLEELRGKVVVVDFWATWCAPCIASFPGMNKAREKYADREDVAFLFVNTWEREDEPTEMVKEFVKKKGYGFQVPMDVESKVVESYGVTGIPTKFIIDKNGKIRFSSVGY